MCSIPYSIAYGRKPMKKRRGYFHFFWIGFPSIFLFQMDITDRSNIGYTFWISPVLKDSSEYNQLLHLLDSQGYKASAPNTFILLDRRSQGAVDSSDVQEIHTNMIISSDSAIGSIILTMGRKPVLMIVGDDQIGVTDGIKKFLAILITRLMQDTRCTIISENLSVIDTMNGYEWQKDLISQGDRRLDISTLSTLRGVQFSRGQPIRNLYRLTSYLLSCLNWEDTSLVAAGAAVISEITGSSLEEILAQGDSCKGVYSWNIHGYMLIRVDRMHGYNFSTPNLDVLLSSLGKKAFLLHSILLKKHIHPLQIVHTK